MGKLLSIIVGLFVLGFGVHCIHTGKIPGQVGNSEVPEPIERKVSPLSFWFFVLLLFGIAAGFLLVGIIGLLQGGVSF